MLPADTGMLARATRPETPVLSVIIPFYNVEAAFEACLGSVLGQDLPDIEILLVDDASPDGSRAIADRAAAADRRVGIITHPENRGLGPARNSGVRHARGDYLFFLDSDDVLADPDALRGLVAEARDSGCRVVVGGCSRLLPDGSVVAHDRLLDGLAGRPAGVAIEAAEALSGVLGLRGAPYLPMRAWGTLIERAYYGETGLDFPPGEHEDMAHTPFLYARAGRVFYDRRIVVHYRVRQDSLSSTRWSAGKIRRYRDLWCETIARIGRFGLHRERGNFAALYAWHLSWKVNENGFEPGAELHYHAAIAQIFDSIDRRTDRRRVFDAVDEFKKTAAGRSGDASRMLAEALPAALLLDYDRAKIRDGLRAARADLRRRPRGAHATRRLLHWLMSHAAARSRGT